MTRIPDCQRESSVINAETLRRNLITSRNWDRVPWTRSGSLRYLFQNKNRTHLEVDGFNFGKQLWSWLYPGLDMSNLTRPEFRRLMEDVIGLATWFCYQTESCTARIVFDSPNCYNKIVNDRVEVIFSGGLGPNRADTVILYDLEESQEYADYDHVVVVTDDYTLGCDALDLGARLLGSVEFCGLLSRKVA